MCQNCQHGTNVAIDNILGLDRAPESVEECEEENDD